MLHLEDIIGKKEEDRNEDEMEEKKSEYFKIYRRSRSYNQTLLTHSTRHSIGTRISGASLIGFSVCLSGGPKAPSLLVLLRSKNERAQ